MIYQQTLTIHTTQRGTTNITRAIADVVTQQVNDKGLCHLFIQHTSASLIICENSDPTVRQDLERLMTQLIPDGNAIFTHTAEGPDDMPAHARTILTQTDLTIPIINHKLALGTWQGIYLWEHRLVGADRHIIVTIQT